MVVRKNTNIPNGVVEDANTALPQAAFSVTTFKDDSTALFLGEVNKAN